MNYYTAPCAYDVAKAEEQRLHALFNKVSTKLLQLASVEYHEALRAEYHKAQRQLLQDVEDANTALLELEEVIDEATTLLESLPDIDLQDLICICAQTEQAKRFLSGARQ